MIRGIPHTSACNAFTGDNHLFGARIVGPTLRTSQHIVTCLDRTLAKKSSAFCRCCIVWSHGFSDNTSASDKERTSERFDNLLSFAIYLALRANKSGANYGAAKAEETAMETGVAEKHTGYGGVLRLIPI